MTELKYPELFQPFKIGNLEIKNRIVMTPMDTKHDAPNDAFNDDTIAYYEERAKGGTGLIVTNCCQATDGVEVSLALPSPFAYPENCRKQLKKLADACHKYDSKIFVQLWNNFGRIAFPIGTEAFVAPSEGPNLWDPEITHRELTMEEVKRIIQANVEAALLCKESGVDGINIVGAYGGYMGDQFATATFNHRKDQYGGDIHGRARVVTEMIQGMKQLCGEDFPVTVRFSTRHHMTGVHHGQIPGEPYQEFGRDVDESIELAKIYVDAGCDAFLIGNGCYDAMFWQYSPMYIPEGAWLDDVRPLTKEVSVPVICPGRILQPEMANEAIKDGTVTAVALGRALLADPQWANKAKNGNVDDIRPCIGCNNGCIGRVMSALPLMCAVNADVLCERNQTLIPTEKPKKIAIIGAGIGGMEVARIAKLRGHDVTIYEKGDKLGGIFVAASAPDFKYGDARLITWYEKQMKDLDIDIKFNSPMTSKSVMDLGADEVVVATGTFPKMPPIPGIDNANTIFAEDILSGKKKAGQKVVVLGAGLIGCESALMLSQDKNVDVTVVEIARYIMTGGDVQPPAANLAYMEEVLGARENVHLLLRTMATSFEKNCVNVTTKRVGESSVENDTVVIAVGLCSDKKIYEELKESFGDHVHLIGDAEAPGTILTAVRSAAKIGKTL